MADELRYYRMFERTAPNYRIVKILEQKLNRHDLQVAIESNRRFQMCFIARTQEVLQSQHFGNRWPMQICVEKSGLFSFECQSNSKVDSYSAFANAAFPGKDNEFPLDA